MKIKDAGRKYMWWGLGVAAAFQLYLVRELLAAFTLFCLGFGAIAAFIGSLYMLHKLWEVGVTRVADSQHPVVNFARRSVFVIEELGRRPFRRPGSATAR
jgi:hypothetical protein